MHIRTIANALRAGIPEETVRSLFPVDDAVRPTVDTLLGFARETGVARHRALSTLADAVDESEWRWRRIRIASTTASQSSIILTSLPIATVFVAQLLGLGTLDIIVGTTLGRSCALLGTVLVAIGFWWMQRIRRNLPNPSTHVGLVVLLAAELTRNGAMSANHLERLGQLADAWSTREEIASIERMTRLSRDHGVPVASLLDLDAERLLSESRLTVEDAVERLPGQLLGPIGACLFPAFVVTTVIPTVAAMAVSVIS